MKMEEQEIIKVDYNENLFPSKTPIRVDFGYRIHYLSLYQAKELSNQLNDVLLGKGEAE